MKMSKKEIHFCKNLICQLLALPEMAKRAEKKYIYKRDLGSLLNAGHFISFIFLDLHMLDSLFSLLILYWEPFPSGGGRKKKKEKKKIYFDITNTRHFIT